MKKIKYGAYTRKSTEDDARQVLSIEAQKDEISKHFGDLAIILEFSESKSAYETQKRSEFNKLLNALDSGEISGVVAWHPDRLSRNETDAAELTRRIRLGVIEDLKFASGVWFDNTPESMMMLQMTQAQSQYYSSKLSKDVRRGNDKKRRMGGLTGRAPEGYLNVNSEVQIDTERFKLLRKAFDLYLTGEFSVPAIHKILCDEWGYRTLVRRRSGGGKLALGSLYNIFRNIRYAGLIPDPYDPEHPHAANFPAMITQAEYYRVQELLSAKGMPRLTPRDKHFALRGLINCGDCGCSITAQTKQKKLKDGSVNYHTYYHCTGKRSACSQKGVYIKEGDLSDQLTSLLDRYEIAPDMYEWAMETFRELSEEEIESRGEIQRMQASAISAKQSELDRLLTAYTRNLIDDVTFEHRSVALKVDLSKLQDEQAGTSWRVKNWYEIATTTLEKLTNINDKFESGDLTTKKDILLAIGQNPVLLNGRLTVTPNRWLTPIEESAQALRLQLDKVRTEPQQMQEASEEALISTWQGH